jgi:hypothetical protein
MQLTPTCPQLLKDAINKFIIVLTETEPQFIAESTIQQLRKTILELMQRIPANDQKSYTKDILISIYRLVEKENEENVLICFRLLIDYYRHLKPQLNIEEVQQFFNFIKNIYNEFPKYLNSIFNYKPSIQCHDISDIDLNSLLIETFSSLQITTDQHTKDNQLITVSFCLITDHF